MNELPCPPELWPEFSALLDQALDLPEEERPQWVDALGPEHEAVRPWLAKVLDVTARAASTRFLERPTVGREIIAEFAAGQNIGPYVLEHELGRGGMGEVWLAARGDGTLNRRVALKLPYAHVMAGVLRRRFERERDILASLSHPHIAQLFDAGVSDNGHPYLAMEWIDGEPITRYCREHKLSLVERLALFRQVLEAVNYAHARLIAHRDLKPSNILVDKSGQVKLLDFGIAKLLGADTSGEATELTRLGGRAITPEYAAPEQIAGEALTTSVDLYALGVVLYELLVGKRPFEGLPKRGPATPTDAPLASSRIDAENAANVGGLDARGLRRALLGDIDAILAKALEAKPERRYRTVEAFAEDLDRSARHEPISARRIGLVAKSVKFVRRHRVGVAMGLLLLLLIVGGSIAIAWQALRAEREAQRATVIKDFLIKIFSASDPRIASDKPRGTVTARELLDLGTQRIEQEFASDPATEIELLGVTANIYAYLDDSDHSVKLMQRRAQLASAHYGEAHPIVIGSLLDQADAAIFGGNTTEATRLLDQAAPLIRRAHLQDSIFQARWLRQRGQSLMSDFNARRTRAEMFDSAAALYARLAPHDPGYPTTLGERGNLYLADDDYAKAAAQYRKAIEVDTTVSPRDDGELVAMYNGLALASQYLSDAAAAEDAYSKATALARRTYGLNNHFYWEEQGNYAKFIHQRGDRLRAKPMFDELIKLLPAPTSGSNASRLNNAAAVRESYGTCLAAEGRPDLAIPLFEAAEQGYLAAPLYDSDLPRLRQALGDAYRRVGRKDEARRLLHTSLEEFSRRGLDEDLDVLTGRERWARLLIEDRDYDQAIAQIKGILAQTKGRHLQVFTRAQDALARIAIARKDVASALALSQQAVASDEDVHGPQDARLHWQLLLTQARAMLLGGQRSAAVEKASSSLQVLRTYDDPASEAIAEAEAIIREAGVAPQSLRPL